MANGNAEIRRTICFDWNGTSYTLEFNRKSAEVLEKKLGVNVSDLVTGSNINITDLPKLFMVSTMMHHPNMKAATVETLYDMMPDKQELLKAFIEMLAATVMDVFEEPEEGKAISWTRQ